MSNERPVIYGDGEQSRDFTYIDNVVAANLSAAVSKDASGKVINVANGERVTLNQLLDELKALIGKADVTAEYLDARVGDVRHSLADVSMARELLGYESRVNLREGLQRTIDWWKISRFSLQIPRVNTRISLQKTSSNSPQMVVLQPHPVGDRGNESVWSDVRTQGYEPSRRRARVGVRECELSQSNHVLRSESVHRMTTTGRALLTVLRHKTGRHALALGAATI